LGALHWLPDHPWNLGGWGPTYNARRARPGRLVVPGVGVEIGARISWAAAFLGRANKKAGCGLLVTAGIWYGSRFGGVGTGGARTGPRPPFGLGCPGRPCVAGPVAQLCTSRRPGGPARSLGMASGQLHTSPRGPCGLVRTGAGHITVSCLDRDIRGPRADPAAQPWRRLPHRHLAGLVTAPGNVF